MRQNAAMATATDHTKREARARWRTNAVICALVAVLLMIPVLFPKVDLFLDYLEQNYGDFLTQGRADLPPPVDMVLIGIDDRSLNLLDIMDEAEIAASEQLEAMSYGWVFPRSVHAALAERLIASGARLIVFDMLFPTEGEGDEELRRVLETYPGKVVIGANISDDKQFGFDFQVQLPSETILKVEDTRDSRLGIATFRPDEADKVIRSAQGLFQLRNHDEAPIYNSMALAALMQLGKVELFPEPGRAQYFRISRDMGSSYIPIPYYTVFSPREWDKNYQSGAYFKDKIVFVGGSSVAQFHDVARVPGGEILGVQLQMTVLAAALAGEFYEAPGTAGKLQMTLLMACLAFGATFILKRPLIGLFVLVGVLVLYAIGIVPLFYYGLDLLLPSAGPSLAFGISGLLCFGSQYAAEILEKARLRRTLERQVSKELAEHILSQPEDYYESLPGVRKPVTILFSDIRSFTTRSEQDDPVELVSQLKEYLDAMGNVVFKHGGVVDKFIGDAVMAVWGNIKSKGVETDARSAVAAAVEMMQVLGQLNRKWETRGWKPFAIGIGLNFGDAIFGLMGSTQKQEMTVIGDPVNQAARLEGLTKKFGEEIVIGPTVAQFLGDSFPLRQIGAIRTKGKDEAAELFAVLGEEAPEGDWLARYHQAIRDFKKGRVKEAEAKFRKCLDEKEGDKLCHMYLEAIAAGDGETGVLTMREK